MLDVELTVGSSFYLSLVKNSGRTCDMLGEGDLFGEAPEGRLRPAKANSGEQRLDASEGEDVYS